MKTRAEKFSLFFFGLALLLVSRLALVTGGVDFFDSAQYIRRTASTDWLAVLTAGHAPYHPGYLLPSALLYRFLNLFTHSVSPALAAGLTSAVFGLLGILAIYFLMREIRLSRPAVFLGAFLLAVNLFYWLTNLTVLVDATTLGVFFLSLFLFARFLRTSRFLWALFSGLALGWAIFSHTAIVFWAFSYFGIYLFLTDKKPLKNLIGNVWPILLGPILAILFYAKLLLLTGHNQNFISAVQYLFTGNASDKPDHLVYPWIWADASHILGVLPLLIGLLVFVWLVFKNLRQATALFLWGVPGLILASQYSYTNLHGRASLPLIVPFIILAALFFEYWQKRKKAIAVLFGLILIFLWVFQSFPWVWRYATTKPLSEQLNILQKKFYSDVGGGLVVVPELARTWMEGRAHKVPEIDGYQKIIDSGETELKEKRPWLVSSDALQAPLKRFDGRSLDIREPAVLDLNKLNQTPLARLGNDYYLTPVASVLDGAADWYQVSQKETDLEKELKNFLVNLPMNKELLAVKLEENGQPISRGVLALVAEKGSRLDYDRLNHFDPLIQLWAKIKKEKPVRVWTVSDQGGLAIMTVPQNWATKNTLVVYLNYLARSPQYQEGKFYQNQQQEFDWSRFDYRTASLDRIVEKLSHAQNELMAVRKEKDYWLLSNLSLSKHWQKTDHLGATAFSFPPNGKVEEVNGQKAIRLEGTGPLKIFGPWFALEKGRYHLSYQFYLPAEDKIELRIGTGDGVIPIKEEKSFNLIGPGEQTIEIEALVNNSAQLEGQINILANRNYFYFTGLRLEKYEKN